MYSTHPVFASALMLVSIFQFYLNNGQVAQSVEQRTENPRVDGSIPPLATIPNI